jgi:prophage tail gpP-like protein
MPNGDVIELPEVQVPSGEAPPMERRTDLPTGGLSRYFDQITVYPYPNHAVVTINGAPYWEWKSVWVQHEFGGVPPIKFQLSTSEQEPWPEDWAFLRIRPNDKCTVHLDSFLACRGKVVTRQVYYDSRQHAIQIQGTDKTGDLAHMSADTKTGEYKGLTADALIKSIAGKHGIGTKTIGSIPGFKIPRFSVTPGESAREAIEKVARHAGLFVSANENGDLELIGNEWSGGYAELIEGRDILIGREQITAYDKPQNMAQSQSAGTDETSMGEAAHGQHADGPSGGGDMSMGGFQRVLSELPSSGIQQLLQRARIEDNVGEQNKIIVTLTVLGWQRPGGGLWRVRDMVFVDAPMLIMKRALIVRKVTFTQDDSTGSRTELELVDPKGMSAKAQAGGG